MKKLGVVIIFVFAAVIGVRAQDAEPVTPCPADKVCISRQAALKAVADADKVIALETESKAKDQAIADIRDALNKMRIEFAEKAGENTALRQNDVSNRAIIDLLLKNTKKRCILSPFCF